MSMFLCVYFAIMIVTNIMTMIRMVWMVSNPLRLHLLDKMRLNNI